MSVSFDHPALATIPAAARLKPKVVEMPALTLQPEPVLVVDPELDLTAETARFAAAMQLAHTAKAERLAANPDKPRQTLIELEDPALYEAPTPVERKPSAPRKSSKSTSRIHEAPKPPSTPKAPLVHHVNVAPVQPQPRDENDIPDEAMFGRLRDIAEGLHAPLGASYCAVLTAVAGMGINMHLSNPSPRPTLYTMLLGGVGTGKSLISNRAIETLGLDQSDEFLRTDVLGSEIGIQHAYGCFGDGDPLPPLRSFLHFNDEQTVTMKKMQIQGSGLPNTLTTLWNKDRIYTASKKGRTGINARVSILGAMKVDSPDDFAVSFGVETAGGFHDRCIFAPCPTGWKFSRKWQANVVEIERINVMLPETMIDRIETYQDECFEQGLEMGRLIEMIGRVAVISSFANGDKVVTPECVEASIRFAQWQYRIRKIYQPGQAENEDARTTGKVLDAFREVLRADKAGRPKLCEGKPVVRDGEWVSWRLLSKSKSWNRSMSSPSLMRVRRSLLEARDIVEFAPPAKDQYDRPKGTNEFRLTGDWEND